jgi:integrase
MAKVIGKSINGIVKIEDDAGRIRLRWTVLGERYCFALGLPVSPASRAFASQKANRIEGDIQSGHFDVSLKSYKPQRAKECRNP